MLCQAIVTCNGNLYLTAGGVKWGHGLNKTHEVSEGCSRICAELLEFVGLQNQLHIDELHLGTCTHQNPRREAHGRGSPVSCTCQW